MTLPMACCLVGIDQTEMPGEGEHHGAGATTVDVVVVAVEHVCDGFHPAGLGALCAIGHAHSVVRGRAHSDSNRDGARPGVALPRAGVLCQVWGLEPYSGRTANAAGGCAAVSPGGGSASPEGSSAEVGRAGRCPATPRVLVHLVARSPGMGVWQDLPVPVQTIALPVGSQWTADGTFIYSIWLARLFYSLFSRNRYNFVNPSRN